MAKPGGVVHQSGSKRWKKRYRLVLRSGECKTCGLHLRWEAFSGAVSSALSLTLLPPSAWDPLLELGFGVLGFVG